MPGATASTAHLAAAAAVPHSCLCPAFQAARWWSTPQYQAALQRPQRSRLGAATPHQAQAWPPAAGGGDLPAPWSLAGLVSRLLLLLVLPVLPVVWWLPVLLLPGVPLCPSAAANRPHALLCAGHASLAQPGPQ
jgi:hypothetical protein